jgi:hypothetical protein
MDIDINILPFTPDELAVILLAVAGRHDSKQDEALTVCRRLAALVANRPQEPAPVAPSPWGFLVPFTVDWGRLPYRELPPVCADWSRSRDQGRWWYPLSSKSTKNGEVVKVSRALTTPDK